MQTARTIDRGNVHIIHDPAIFAQMDEQLFDPDALSRQGLLERRTTGRQSAFVFRIDGRSFVLRHYWRGGLVGRVIDDTYLWTGLARSRPLREWRMTSKLAAAGLPVPQPVAARVVRQGLVYRGDFITIELPRTMTLADRLAQAPLSNETWLQITTSLARLHRYGAYHADLNARNVLLDHDDRVFVIDWDRGRLLPLHYDWQHSNMKRLIRSLEKLKYQSDIVHYTTQLGEKLVRDHQVAVLTDALT